MGSTFPLFQLPERAIKTVIKYYDVTELIFFSTFSNRAKCFVKSDKRNAYLIEIDIERGCIVYLNCDIRLYLGESQQKESDIQSLSPCSIRVKELRYLTENSLFLEGFSVRDSLVHFMSIFNCPKVNLDFGPRDKWMYSLDSVRKIVEGIPIKQLSVSENACEIIKLFPNMNSLRLKRFALEQQLSEADLNFIKKVLIGNIPCLEIHRSIPIDLNTLLLLNSPEISISRSSITDKHLNKFIKLWLGGSCPNLQELDICNRDQYRNGFILDHSVVIKEIKYEEFEDDGLFGRKYTIRKKDGTRALLSILPFLFSFNVLDHDNRIV